MADRKPDMTFVFQKADNYSNFNDIIEAFPHLEKVNTNSIDFKNVKTARCFVIRSNTDDDVHKAIKYAVWTSTPKNSEKLNQAFVDGQKEGTDVFLFFSVVKSGQFEGVARLTSELQQQNFPYWWQQGKWKSLFEIEWIYIKDVAYKHLDGIFNVDDMIITRSRDGTEVSWEDNGKKMFEIFSQMDNNESIFKDFAELDERELQLRDQKYSPSRQNRQQGGYQNDYYNQQMQQQYMQMMNNMWMYQQMFWQQSMYGQQMPLYAQQQQIPQQQNFQQEQVQSQETAQEQVPDTTNMNPNMQNFQQPQQPEQIQQFQSQ